MRNNNIVLLASLSFSLFVGCNRNESAPANNTPAPAPAPAAAPTPAPTPAAPSAAPAPTAAPAAPAAPTAAPVAAQTAPAADPAAAAPAAPAAAAPSGGTTTSCNVPELHQCTETPNDSRPAELARQVCESAIGPERHTYAATPCPTANRIGTCSGEGYATIYYRGAENPSTLAGACSTIMAGTWTAAR